MNDTKSEKKVKVPILKLLIAFLLIALIFQTSKAITYNMQTLNPFETRIIQGSSLGFKLEDKEVTLILTVGSLNGSNCNAWLAADAGGKFEFFANENAQIELYETVDFVRVNGVGYGSGDIFNIVSGNLYVIEWSFVAAPILPILFIIGMIGICSMVGGPSYAVYKIKRKEYEEGLINGVIIFAIGLGFFIGWLSFGGL